MLRAEQQATQCVLRERPPGGPLGGPPEAKQKCDVCAIMRLTTKKEHLKCIPGYGEWRTVPKREYIPTANS